MVFSSLPLRLKILTSKFTQSLGLPFRKVLPSTIQGVTDDLKLNIATELLTLLLGCGLFFHKFERLIKAVKKLSLE
jgi:hypothetical protein